jgi:ABC-type transport system involved in multi-copper enzyme maturation permease subunit
MSALSRLLAAEFTKAVRLKLPWMGLAFSALMAVVARHTVERMAAPGELSTRVYLTANMNLLSTSIIPIFSTVFAATLMASETSRGTLRMILPRPIWRSTLLHAKLFTGLGYLLLMFLANLAVALPIAASYPVQNQFDIGIDLPGLPSQLLTFAITLALTYLPHAATVCFALLISVISRSVATAIGVAVGMVLCLFPIQIIRIGNINIGDYMFSSYYDDAIGLGDSIASGFPEKWTQENIQMLILTSAISAALFLAAAYYTFTRRDLNG